MSLLLVVLSIFALPGTASAAEDETAPTSATATDTMAAGAATADSKPTPPDNKDSSLLLLGGQSSAQTVTLSRDRDGTLRGELVLLVRSTKTADAIGVTYLPFGPAGAPAGAAELKPESDEDLEKDRASSITLVFTLPGEASPTDLSGIVVLQPRVNGEAAGKRFELAVTGAGPALKGVSIQPEKLEIDVVGGLGSWLAPDEESAKVQLYGPGVPSLLEERPPSFNLLLRSDHGAVVNARLTELKPTADSARATATVKIEGDLSPGKYEGAAPITSLSSDAPKLSLALESGNSFVLAALVVFIGALAGGAIYLASSRRRRKSLLRDEVKSLLDNYQHILARMPRDGDGEPLLWTLKDYLGKNRDEWYHVKWNAVPDFDGAVQTIWSDIHWARNDDDLDEVAKQVAELRARIVRWITVANNIASLAQVTKLDPHSIAGEEWKECETPLDTMRLLAQIREIEPPDDKASKELTARIKRQVRWQVAMAEVWNARALLKKDMTDHRERYGPGDHLILKEADLEKLDKCGKPESKRSAEKQIDLMLTLDHHIESIRAVYKGEKALDLAVPPTTRIALAEPGQSLVAAAGAAPGGVEEAVVEENLAGTTRPEAGQEQGIAERLRGAGATDHEGERLRVPTQAIAKRDAFWTVSIALVTSAAYIPTIYNPAWGTGLDYVGAFAAGFLGKAAINWAALPLFQSLRPSKRGPEGEKTEGGASGDTAGAKASAGQADEAAESKAPPQDEDKNDEDNGGD